MIEKELDILQERQRLRKLHYEQRFKRLCKMENKVHAYCILHRMYIGCDICKSSIGDECGENKFLRVQ